MIATRRRSRPLLVVALGVVVLGGACTASPAPAPHPTSPPHPGPRTPLATVSPHPGHVWWGTGGGNVLGFLPHLEAEIGRPFAVVRRYSTWDTPLPTALHRTIAARGSIPYVSWELYGRHGTALTFADVTNGSQDAWIRKQAESIKASGIHMLFTFQHEPEFAQGEGAKPQAGPPDLFVAAFDRIHRIFAQVGVTNVAWVADLGELTFHGENGGPSAWMPPAADYTYVGVDGYLKWPCEPRLGYRSFAQMFGPAERFAKAAGKPLIFGEVGVQEFTACGHAGSPAGKANWIAGAVATIESWQDVRAICWTYGSNFKTNRNVTLVWKEDSSPQALAAFRAAGLEPYFMRAGWP